MAARLVVLLGLGLWPALAGPPAAALAAPAAGSAAAADCGRGGPGSPAEACFTERVAQCAPATAVLELADGPDEPVNTWRYEVLGPRGGLCEFRMTAVEYAHPDYVGTEIVCTLDPAAGLGPGTKPQAQCGGST
jgi:hypothetical protein